MSGLKFFVSNKLEILSKRLSKILINSLESPFDKEIFVVQNKGMMRWISIELAKYHGICANFSFKFPNEFIYESIQNIIPDVPEKNNFNREILTFKIFDFFTSHHNLLNKDPKFKTINTYIGKKINTLKCYQLSERIAYLFDQYLFYRPFMILDWEKNNEQQWQAILWQEISKDNKKFHQATLLKAFIRKLSSHSNEKFSFPERISVFGITALPNFHMRILSEIAKFSNINIFLLNPCKEYWGDIPSNYEIKKIKEKYHKEDIELFIEQGNSLLASMGKIGRDFFDLLNDYDCEINNSLFDPPQRINLLSSIQSDIVNLTNGKETPYDKKIIDNILNRKDNSVQIISCHSPGREIEILYNHLLLFFDDKNKNIYPENILVMTPDIKIYVPYIKAVFKNASEDKLRIPYSIADKNIISESRIVESFVSILALSGSRFSSSQIMSILDSECISKKFELNDSDIELIRKWINETGIRWGIDKTTSEKLNLPQFNENTFQTGIKRMLLGYAMPGEGENTYHNILPYDLIEGENSIILGKFINFTENIFSFSQKISKPMTLVEWISILSDLINQFFINNKDSVKDIQLIRKSLLYLRELHDLSGFNNQIGIDIIKYYFNRIFNNNSEKGFISGGVTFCEMLPMRSIPFKVICLIGMNDNKFPRQSRHDSFDLISLKPEKGDRSLRDEDRYLFIETLMSARKNLYISYIGQSINDNSSIPPSVVVNELMDYIEENISISKYFREVTDTLDQNISDIIITKHPLHPFSPKYFKDEIDYTSFLEKNHLFSYSMENYIIAKNLCNKNLKNEPFFTKELPTPDNDLKSVHIEDLCNFFKNPSKFILKNRLGIDPGSESLILVDHEPFDIRGLDKYNIEQTILEKKMSGFENIKIKELIKSSGMLPPGNYGDIIFDKLYQPVDAFIHKLNELHNGQSKSSLNIDVKIDDFHIIGEIDNIYRESLIQFRYAEIKTKDILNIWIHHLVINAINHSCYNSSKLASLSGNNFDTNHFTIFSFSPQENSKYILKKLLQIYWLGLSKPLHFFAEISFDYAKTVLKNKKDSQKALLRAQKKWFGEHSQIGLSNDYFNHICYRNINPIDKEFENLSIKIFKPVLENMS